MVSTHLKNISQNGSFPQIGVKIKNVWNHHLGMHSNFRKIPETCLRFAAEFAWFPPPNKGDFINIPRKNGQQIWVSLRKIWNIRCAKRAKRSKKAIVDWRSRIYGGGLPIIQTMVVYIPNSKNNRRYHPQLMINSAFHRLFWINPKTQSRKYTKQI